MGLLPKSLKPVNSLAQTSLEAQQAESSGFGRYWLAEHYDEQCAWSYTPPLAAALLANTRRIRIGTGGVLLNVHRPYRVACDAQLLSNLYPNRFELGIGRGAAAEPWRSLLTDSKDSYEEKIKQLLSHLNKMPSRNKITELPALPMSSMHTQCWLLSSSNYSANLANKFQIGACISLFHEDSYPARPEVNTGTLIAVAGSCSSSQETAIKYLEEEDICFWPKIVGTGEQCIQQMKELQKKYGAEGVLFAELVRHHEYRLNSMCELASANS